MLELRDVEKRWDDVQGGRTLFAGISEQFHPGLSVISGRNGAGKSTLLRCIAGELNLERGEVRVLGERIDLRPRHLRSAFFVRQNPHNNLAPELSVYENILAAASSGDFWVSKRSAEMILAVHDNGSVGMRSMLSDGLLDAKAGTLSGGEAQCLSLILAIVSREPIVLADEPTSNLDTDHHKEVLSMITTIAASRVFLAATHDKDLVALANLEVKLDTASTQLEA